MKCTYEGTKREELLYRHRPKRWSG